MDVATLGIEAKYTSVKGATKALDRLDDSARRAEVGIGNLDKTSGSLGATMARTAGKLGLVGVAFAAIAGAKAAISSARDFSGALAEVSTLIEGTTAEMAALDAQSLRLASTFGGTATDQANAFYQAISAGAGDVAEATAMLETANRLAIGGVTDVATSIDVLTTATNVYAASGLTATQASDALFVGMKAGKTTISELSSGIGKLLPLGSALGLSFDDLVAATSALTKGGISTAESITGLRATLAAITGPSEQAKELAKDLGIEFNAAGLAATEGGLSEFLDDVISKTDGSTAKLQRLFGGVEATGVALAFAGQSGQFYNEILDDMDVKVGATTEAYDKMSDALDNRLNVAMGDLGSMATQVGGVLLSALVPAVEGVVSAVHFLVDNADVLAAVMVTIAATQIPLMVTAMATGVTSIAALGGAAEIAAGALKFLGVAIRFAGGPLTLFVSLLAGAASYFLIFKDNAQEAEDGSYDAAAGMYELNAAMGVFYTAAAPNAARAAQDVANKNVILAKSAVDAARAEILKQKALNMAFNSPDATGWNKPAAGFSDALDSKLASQNDQLDNLLAKLDDAERRQKASANAITGSMSETMTNSILPPTDLPDVIIPDIPDIGGGGGIRDTFADRMQALTEGLMSEKQLVDEWHNGALATLNEARELEKITDAEYSEYKLQVEQEYWDRLRDIKANGIAGALGQTSDYFGDMNDLAGGGYDSLLRAQKVFAAAEAVVNTYRAAAQTLADKDLPWYAKIAAAGSIIAAGMGFVNSIKSGGSGGGGGGGASGTSAAPPPAADTSTQRVLLDFQGRSMVSVEMLDEIISGIQSESKNGSIIEVAR